MGLAQYGGAFKGAVLVGSGPSLTRGDLHKVCDVPMMAFNRSYKDWSNWPRSPDFFVCADPELAPQLANDIATLSKSLQTRFFLHEAARDLLPASASIEFISFAPNAVFSMDFRNLADFGNVGATSLQVLAGLGFRKIVLLGVDALYRDVTNVEKIAAIAGIRDDDHFIPDYRAGLSFDTAALRSDIVEGWARAAVQCDARNISVRNASRMTTLSCFVRCDLDDALGWLTQA